MAELSIVDLPFEYEDDILVTPVDPGFVVGSAGGDTFRSTGRELLLVNNPTGGALLITVTSSPHSRTKRTGDITNASIAGGAVGIFQLFPRDGWESGGVISILAAVTLEVAVVRLPRVSQD